jgi:EF hand
MAIIDVKKSMTMNRIATTIFGLGLLIAFPAPPVQAQPDAEEQVQSATTEPPVAKKKKKKTPMERFQAADANHDGKISRAELNSADPRFDCLYDLVDTDGDDAVTPGDLLTAYLSWASGLLKPPSGDVKKPCLNHADEDKGANGG